MSVIAPAAASSRRAATALIATVVVLAAARALLTFAPTMDAWSLNLHRFLPPWAAWGLWLVSVLALVPAVMRRMRRPAEWLGDVSVGRGGVVVWVPVAAIIVCMLPDQTHMTGDFILRQRAIEEGRSPALLFPQALPLDVWIHHTVPRAVFVHFGVSPNTVARIWGGLDAGLMAWTAVVLARALRVSGAAALTCVGSVVFSGALALFTGYGKGLADLTVAVVSVAAFGAQVASTGTGFIPLGVATAIAIALHRVGFLLAPAMLAAWWLGVRKTGISWRALACMALPVGAAAWVGTLVVALIGGFDLPSNVVSGGSLQRFGDLANALLLTAPLAPLVPVLAITWGPGLPRKTAIVPAVLIAIAFVGLALVVKPQQGIVRDWDVFAPTGVALALLAAWLAAESVAASDSHDSERESGRRARAVRTGSTAGGVAVAVVLAAAVPSLQWLIHLHDVTRGMQRIRAVIAGPPQRSNLERARLWDYLGIRNAWLDDWSATADAFAQSAALLPTPRVLEQWARAEMHVGDWDRAREICLTWTQRAPEDLSAWRFLAATVTRMNDRETSRVAAEHILRLNPHDRDAEQILEYLSRTESGTGGP